jgi:hypothetical protein
MLTANVRLPGSWRLNLNHQLPLVGCGSYIWLLGCAAWAAPSTMPQQQHLVDIAGAALIGLVFSAV